MTEERDGDHAPRRRLLKKLAAGGSAASLAALPGKWAKPVVASVILPAHAQTSPGCVGTLDNCPSGFLFNTSGPLAPLKYIATSVVTEYFPAISYGTDGFTGSDTYQTSEIIGPCPSPCDNAEAGKYITYSLSFTDSTAFLEANRELRCGGDVVQDVSFQFSGTYATAVNDERGYSGSGSFNFEACKYLSGLERARSGSGGSRILRNFRFGR